MTYINPTTLVAGQRVHIDLLDSDEWTGTIVLNHVTAQALLVHVDPSLPHNPDAGGLMPIAYNAIADLQIATDEATPHRHRDRIPLAHTTRTALDATPILRVGASPSLDEPYSVIRLRGEDGDFFEVFDRYALTVEPEAAARVAELMGTFELDRDEDASSVIDGLRRLAAAGQPIT